MPRHLRGGSFHFNFDLIRYDTFAWEKRFSIHTHTYTQWEKEKKREAEWEQTKRAGWQHQRFQRRRSTIIFFLFFFSISIDENHPRAILLLQNLVMSEIISMHLSPIALQTQHAQYFALLFRFGCFFLSFGHSVYCWKSSAENLTVESAGRDDSDGVLMAWLRASQPKMNTIHNGLDCVQYLFGCTVVHLLRFDCHSVHSKGKLFFLTIFIINVVVIISFLHLNRSQSKFAPQTQFRTHTQ